MTPDEKHIRMVMSLANFEANQDGFRKRFVTQDEYWVHHFKAETKQQLMQWKHKTSPASKKAKKGGGLSRKNDGFRILGCKKHFDNGVPLKRLQYQQRRVQCQFIKAVAKRNQVKAAWNAAER